MTQIIEGSSLWIRVNKFQQSLSVLRQELYYEKDPCFENEWEEGHHAGKIESLDWAIDALQKIISDEWSKNESTN